MRIAFLGILTFLSAHLARTESIELKTANQFVDLPLKCIQKEYPNKLDHTLNNNSEVLSPKTLHPVFYGCFDWHSAVHGHWLLVALLKRYPQLNKAKEIRKILSEQMTIEKFKKEINYLEAENRKSFERTYGWAWLFKLTSELKDWNDSDAHVWLSNLKALTDEFVKKLKLFLPKQNYPIRTGVHPNTAFTLILALEFAKAFQDLELEKLITERAKTYYLTDQKYPMKLEPSGEDFLSPALLEAVLMSEILSRNEFQKWAEQFFSGYKPIEINAILNPVTVLDRTDPKLVHLDGLNFSRAWCFRKLALRIPQKTKLFEEAAQKHFKQSLPFLSSGQYEGEHWLASFATLSLL